MTDPNVPDRLKHSRFARLHPKAFLAAYGAAGLLLSAACTWLFLGLADEVGEHGWLVRLDHSVTDWLQAHGTEWGESVFVGVSYLGAQVLIAGLVIFAIVLAYRRNWYRLVALAFVCGGGSLLGFMLKQIFHRNRPVYASEFAAHSWSFPSGHAMDSVIVYGFMAYWLAYRRHDWKRRILIGTVAIVATIGYARIYLGVHYLSDVVAGYAAGFVWLRTCVTGLRFARERRLGKTPS